MSDGWRVELPGGPIKLSAEIYGDQFIHYLTQHLVQAYPGIGALEVTAGLGVSLVRFRAGELRSTLHLVPGDGLVAVAVLGAGDQDGQIEPWFAAVKWALKSYKKTGNYRWWAVISAGAEWLYSPILEMAVEARVGEIRLTPTSVYTEAPSVAFVHSRKPEKPVQLIVASGALRSHTVFAAMELATAQLRDVCGLLALVTESPWTLRSMPNIVEEPFKPEDINLQGWGASGPDDIRVRAEMSSQKVEMPLTMAAAAAKIRKNPWLSHLVSAYHEALELCTSHESFAVIGFVSIIEEVGNRHAGTLPRCGECEAIKESGKRFRGSLRRVLPAGRADILGDAAYKFRSKTAHAGRLHGNESSFGLFSPSNLLGTSKTAPFPTLLFQLRLAAGRLLRLELGIDTESEVPEAKPMLGPEGAVHQKRHPV
jgi:hypothetical protein